MTGSAFHPAQVREAHRTRFPRGSFPAEADDDPNHAEEVSQEGTTIQPHRRNLSAEAQELVRETHLNLGHPTKLWFLRVPRSKCAT